MVIELLESRTYVNITISCSADLDTEMQKFGYTRVIPSDIRDYNTLPSDVRNFRLYTDMQYLYPAIVTQGIKYKNVALGKVAAVIPSTKFDLGTKTIELTDIEIFHLKCELEHICMMDDIRQKWDDLTADGEIPEDLNPDITHLLELVESRQTGDFTYNDAYWRTIEDAIDDYIMEVQDETI